MYGGCAGNSIPVVILGGVKVLVKGENHLLWVGYGDFPSYSNHPA